MTRIFRLHNADEEEYAGFGVAYGHANIDLFPVPKSGVSVHNWAPISLELRNGEFPDYLANDLGLRLCSSRMKNVIADYSTTDDVQWLEVEVHKGGNRVEPYFILHFAKTYDVLNRQKSIIVNDELVIKPVISIDVAKDMHLFTIPGAHGRICFISEDLKLHLEGSKISGVSFESAPTA